MYRYLFGPVPSRRLGYSLGVELVPGKICSFDCVFCQAGRTTGLTLERSEHVPVADVIREFESWLAAKTPADYITLAGSGEPTLNTGFGRFIDAVHDKCAIRTALLSNGSLFYIPEVRAEASKSDLVKVSLSGWDQTSFEKINRPHRGLDFRTVLGGLCEFGSMFKGELWLEVFVVRGINDSEDAMRRIAALAEKIGPDRIHLNTVARPPADSSAGAVSPEVLGRLAGLFNPLGEVIASFHDDGQLSAHDRGVDDVEALVSRHPCRLEEIAAFFANDLAATEAMLRKMIDAGKVRQEKHGSELFYTAVNANVHGAAKDCPGS